MKDGWMQDKDPLQNGMICFTKYELRPQSTRKSGQLPEMKERPGNSKITVRIPLKIGKKYSKTALNCLI